MLHLIIGFQVLIPMILIGFRYRSESRSQPGFERDKTGQNPFATGWLMIVPRQYLKCIFQLFVRIAYAGRHPASYAVRHICVVVARGEERPVFHRLVLLLVPDIHRALGQQSCLLHIGDIGLGK